MRAVRSSFLTHYWLGRLCAGSWKQFFLLTIGSGGPLCGQLEAVFLLTIGWGDFVRVVGSSFSYSLLPRGGLVRAVGSSLLAPNISYFEKFQNPKSKFGKPFFALDFVVLFFQSSCVFFFTFVLLFVIAVLLVLINLLV